MRTLPHAPNREVFIQHDKDFVSTVYYKKNSTHPVIFMRELNGQFTCFEPGYNDWYILVAIEKLNKLTCDRDKITSNVLLNYRWAIREGFNHMLDTRLQNPYDHPCNKNTIDGVLGYIENIRKKSEAEMEAIRGIE